MYPTAEAKAYFMRSVHVLDSTIKPIKGNPRKGPINAQNIIWIFLSATVLIYIVEATSITKADIKIITYLNISTSFQVNTHFKNTQFPLSVFGHNKFTNILTVLATVRLTLPIVFWSMQKRNY